jgi:hypothetical protein
MGYECSSQVSQKPETRRKGRSGARWIFTIHFNIIIQNIIPGKSLAVSFKMYAFETGREALHKDARFTSLGLTVEIIQNDRFQ